MILQKVIPISRSPRTHQPSSCDPSFRPLNAGITTVFFLGFAASIGLSIFTIIREAGSLVRYHKFRTPVKTLFALAYIYLWNRTLHINLRGAYAVFIKGEPD